MQASAEYSTTMMDLVILTNADPREKKLYTTVIPVSLPLNPTPILVLEGLAEGVGWLPGKRARLG